MSADTTTMPSPTAMIAEAARNCSGCGKPTIHANHVAQRGLNDLEPHDFVCIDQRVGFLHEGECCRCFDARTWEARPSPTEDPGA